MDTAAVMTIGFGLSIDDINLPTAFRVHQNYPNPFNPSTNIDYDLPEDSFVSITIFDMMGRIINQNVFDNQSAGFQSFKWSGTNDRGSPVSAGVYFYSIRTKNNFETRKMIMLK